MSTQLAQKIKQDTHEKFEELKQRSVEKARENFTRLPSVLIEQVFGVKNFTPFNEEVRDKMGESFKQQDAPKIDETRSELEALKTQMDFMRKEEGDARQYFQNKKEERKKAEIDEEEKRAIEEARRVQAALANAEPTTKARRGEERRRPTETVENKASFGKQ